eukprot:TRINITY_DN2366_c0_g2_i1.p1 TRINITY_DN2366_c0_g2~~TRINITY_DN2366_c0_g2_i1.p1  ORF type:complete len:339 (+),score=13.70 TRINITY_DN2366_c0_g2_i1:248-1264(+)
MSSIRVLYLVGSTHNDFYLNLARKYGNSSLTKHKNFLNYEQKIAYITLDGQWRFPQSLDQIDIDDAKPYYLPEALQHVITLKIDVVLPLMFCVPGVTNYRAIFELLNIPVVGQTPELMAITANKARAKAIVAAGGVSVPFGEVLRIGDVPTIPPPAIVKPLTEDNSLGVSLVRKVGDYDKALKLAFEYSDEVLVENYIEAGREVRCGIIVKNDELICLPIEEYPLRPECPVRTTLDKIPENNQPKICWIVDQNDPITETVQQEALKCYKALGCRIFGLFDFRVDPQGKPWFIEAGLYCTYTDTCIVSVMSKANGYTVEQVLQWAIEETLKQKKKPRAQ